MDNKGFVWAIVVVVVVVVLAGAAVWYYSINKSPASIEQNTGAAVVPTSTQTTIPATSSTTVVEPRTYKNQPGKIISITANAVGWAVIVDLFNRNPNWLPGVDSSGPFFLDQHATTSLSVVSTMKAYLCNGSVAEKLAAPSTLIKQNVTVYFDAEGSSMTSVYQQCLP